MSKSEFFKNPIESPNANITPIGFISSLWQKKKEARVLRLHETCVSELSKQGTCGTASARLQCVILFSDLPWILSVAWIYPDGSPWPRRLYRNLSHKRKDVISRFMPAIFDIAFFFPLSASLWGEHGRLLWPVHLGLSVLAHGTGGMWKRPVFIRYINHSILPYGLSSLG